MHIVVCCATKRGARFVEELISLCPECTLTVVTFPEEPWEPPFVDRITEEVRKGNGRLLIAEQGKLDSVDFDWINDSFDLLFAVSWRYIIPERIYSRADIGAYVFHDSMLPEYRGFSPTVWAIANGKDHTGVTLFEMVKRADEGNVIDQERVEISADSTIAEVLEGVTDAYMIVLKRAFQSIADQSCTPKPQDHSRATYNPRRSFSDNIIYWSKPARELYNLIRAVTYPYPGAITHIGEVKVKVRSARLVSRTGSDIPGKVLDVTEKGAIIATGDGYIMIESIEDEKNNSLDIQTMFLPLMILGM